jgi:hypothetical protein
MPRGRSSSTPPSWKGATLRAGAVAAVQNVANPISVARAIMEKSDTVLLVGLGATRFAKEHGIATCGQDALITGREIARWREAQASGTGTPARRKGAPGRSSPGDTVGAVALDAKGTIASGTSTGGTPNKHQGRVGDSALIGCGTYADNAVGGVSSTGWGEALIRVVMAKSVIDMMQSNGDDPERAAKDAIAALKKRTGGQGGVSCPRRLRRGGNRFQHAADGPRVHHLIDQGSHCRSLIRSSPVSFCEDRFSYRSCCRGPRFRPCRTAAGGRGGPGVLPCKALPGVERQAVHRGAHVRHTPAPQAPDAPLPEGAGETSPGRRSRRRSRR